jgi:NADH dehydrogenase
VKIVVTGATGFVGPSIVRALRVEGRDIRALARRPDRASNLASLGVEVVPGDVTEPESLKAAFDGCTHAVHLVAIIQGRPDDFHRVMTVGTQNVVTAATAAGAERFVLMSALGTSDPPSVPYYAAKLAEERELIASGLAYTIFRPSFIFGPGGGALATFVRQVKVSPVVTVIGSGRQRSQPIWRDDVAAYFARAIDDPKAANRLFELGGPDTVSWDELYLLIAKVLGKRRRLVHIPAGVARTGARLTERLPGAPLSVDQVTMIEGADNVVSSSDAVDTFSLPLLPLEEQIRRATA